MAHCNRMQQTGTHCHTLQHAPTHCNALQHTATHCNTLQHTARHCKTLQDTATHHNTLGSFIYTNCNKLQQTATRATKCNTLQHTAAHCNTLQLPRPHCNTLWTHFITVQHTSIPLRDTLQSSAMGWLRLEALKITGLFCRISSLLWGSFAKETCNFKEPTYCSDFVHLATLCAHLIGQDQRIV